MQVWHRLTAFNSSHVNSPHVDNNGFFTHPPAHHQSSGIIIAHWKHARLSCPAKLDSSVTLKHLDHQVVWRASPSFCLAAYCAGLSCRLNVSCCAGCRLTGLDRWRKPPGDSSGCATCCSVGDWIRRAGAERRQSLSLLACQHTHARGDGVTECLPCWCHPYVHAQQSMASIESKARCSCGSVRCLQILPDGLVRT